jgi:hypothetical protein
VVEFDGVHLVLKLDIKYFSLLNLVENSVLHHLVLLHISEDPAFDSKTLLGISHVHLLDCLLQVLQLFLVLRLQELVLAIHLLLLNICVVCGQALII